MKNALVKRVSLAAACAVLATGLSAAEGVVDRVKLQDVASVSDAELAEEIAKRALCKPDAEYQARAEAELARRRSARGAVPAAFGASGTVLCRLRHVPGRTLAAFRDGEGRDVLTLSFDRDQVFRAVFRMADGSTRTVARRLTAADDLSGSAHHLALAWDARNRPRLFVNGLPYPVHFMPGDSHRVDIGGHAVATARTFCADPDVEILPRMMSNAEIVDSYRRFMPVDLVGEDVDQTVSAAVALPFTVAPGGTFMRPNPAPDRPVVPATVSFTAEVVGRPESLTRFENVTVDAKRTLALRPVALPVGAYRVRFAFPTGFARVIRYNVMPPAPALQEPTDAAWTREELLADVRLGREAGPRCGDQFSFVVTVPESALGRPCVDDFEWPDDKRRVMGLYAHLATACPQHRDRLGSGVIAGGVFPNSGRTKVHSVLFFPSRTNTLFEARTLVAGRPAALAGLRLWRLAEPLPVLKVERPDWTRGRTFGHCDEDQTPDTNFNRDLNGEDTERILRELVRYLKYTGQNLFQYGGGLRYSVGLGAHEGAFDDGEGMFPVHLGEYPYVARELTRAGIAYSGIVYGGRVPEAFEADFIDSDREEKGWFLRTTDGRTRPGCPMPNPACAGLVDAYFGHFADSLLAYAANGMRGVRYDINSFRVNSLEPFDGVMAFGAWPGSLWGRADDTAEDRVSRVTALVGRFAARLKAKDLDTWIGISVSPSRRLKAMRDEQGVDLARLAAVPGVKLALNRGFTQYWWDLFRGMDEPPHNDFYYDAKAPEWAAFRAACGGAVPLVCSHACYLETFQGSPDQKGYAGYFQNSDPKPNGRYFLKEPAFAVGLCDALNYAIGDQPVGTLGNEEEAREFARAYEMLPALPFDDMAGDSPTVVGRCLETDGHGFYFYFVNLHHADQSVRYGGRTIALKPFELRSFREPAAGPRAYSVVRSEAAKADDAARLAALRGAVDGLRAAGVKAEAPFLAAAERALAAYDLPEAHRLLHTVAANALEAKSAHLAEVAEEAKAAARGVWRINCGNTDYSRADGDLFSPDRPWDGETYGWYGASGKSCARDTSGLRADVRRRVVYETEKYDIDGYRVRVGRPGRYRVRVLAKCAWALSYRPDFWKVGYAANGRPLFPEVDFWRDQENGNLNAVPKLEGVAEVGADGLLDIRITSPVSDGMRLLCGLEIERLPY